MFPTLVPVCPQILKPFPWRCNRWTGWHCAGSSQNECSGFSCRPRPLSSVCLCEQDENSTKEVFLEMNFHMGSNSEHNTKMGQKSWFTCDQCAADTVLTGFKWCENVLWDWICGYQFLTILLPEKHRVRRERFNLPIAMMPPFFSLASPPDTISKMWW